MFQPKVLKFDGGYLTYSIKENTVNISPNFQDAFIFTTDENYQIIVANMNIYIEGFYPRTQEENTKWQNPQWIDVEVNRR